MVYVGNAKQSTQKGQKVINKLSKGTGYKSTIQKSIAFLYISDYHIETEILSTRPFTVN